MTVFARIGSSLCVHPTQVHKLKMDSFNCSLDSFNCSFEFKKINCSRHLKDYHDKLFSQVLNPLPPKWPDMARGKNLCDP